MKINTIRKVTGWQGKRAQKQTKGITIFTKEGVHKLFLTIRHRYC